MAIRKHLVVLALSSLLHTGCESNGKTPNVSLSQTTPQAPVAAPNTAANTTANSEPTPANAEPFVIGTETPDNPLTCDASLEQMQTVFIELINQVRAQPRQCGDTSHEAAGPLSWNTKLVVAAQRHSADMSVNNFFSHTGSGNTSSADRVDAVNYEWQFVGENLAAGQPSLKEAMTGWLDSPGHCSNIMSESFKEAGLACAENQSTEFGIYWTNVFGTQFE